MEAGRTAEATKRPSIRRVGEEGRKHGGRAEAALPAAVERKAADAFAGTGLPRRFGRYLLLRMLARGGMGQVFLASTTGVEGAERPVVVKVIRREHARDPNFLARFLDEARVQAQLMHSGVAQILEAATHEGGEPYVVMEHVEGRSLGQVRRRIADVGLRLRWEEAVAIGVLLGEALAHVHERCDASGRPLSIVHRDLSPHNVMVGFAGEVKIIDFGTARAENRRCHTVAGVVFAKPGYVAPEVANGDSGDSRVDLYAAGVMVWELCAGRRFLQGEAQDHMAEVAAGRRELMPIAAAVGAPAELDEVLQRMSCHDREKRFASTRAACARLAAMLEHARPLSNGERGVRARAAQLMYTLYPSQPGRSRREFGELVAAARKLEPEPWTAPVETTAADTDADDGFFSGTRYVVRREIGRGASSVVLEAEHVDLSRRVAIKVLDPEHTHSKDFQSRFRREARALSRLQHPGLVRVFDFGQARDGRLYCVMELVEGRSLRAELDAEYAFDWRQGLRVARQVCLALEVAHRHGIVHRDIKPENLLMSPDGSVKLLDFGLSKSPDEVGARAAADAGDEPALGAMTLFGTPEYMAPEQAAGGRVDHRSDLYALGCVLYEMLSGKLPFAAASAVQVLDKKLRGSPEPVGERAPSRGIPASVSRLVHRALARHPARRFQSAAEMAAAIELALDEPTRRRVRRRAAGAAVVAGVMGFSLVLLVQQARPWLDRLPERLPWLQSPATPAGRDATPPAGSSTSAPACTTCQRSARSP
jgi:eukaryotic-like serine/threonine-protein kinase